MPIKCGSVALQAPFPDATGLRARYGFVHKDVIAWHHYPAHQHEIPNLKPQKIHPTRIYEPGEGRFASLQMRAVDSSKGALWLLRAGVMTEPNEIYVPVSGIVGVVEADDLLTDLTGSGFRRSKEYEELSNWIRDASVELLTDAIAKPYKLNPKVPTPEVDPRFTLLMVVVFIVSVIVAIVSVSEFLVNDVQDGAGALFLKTVVSVTICVGTTFATEAYKKVVSKKKERELIEELLSELKQLNV